MPNLPYFILLYWSLSPLVFSISPLFSTHFQIYLGEGGYECEDQNNAQYTREGKCIDYSIKSFKEYVFALKKIKYDIKYIFSSTLSPKPQKTIKRFVFKE